MDVGLGEDSPILYRSVSRRIHSQTTKIVMKYMTTYFRCWGRYQKRTCGRIYLTTAAADCAYCASLALARQGRVSALRTATAQEINDKLGLLEIDPIHFDQVQY
jgi:hypothetical protein